MLKTQEHEIEELVNILQKCHTIIRNNDKLSPEAAYDELLKILCLKISDERKPNIDNLIFLDPFAVEEWEYKDYINDWFRFIEEEFNDSALYDNTEPPRIKRESLREIFSLLVLHYDFKYEHVTGSMLSQHHNSLWWAGRRHLPLPVPVFRLRRNTGTGREGQDARFHPDKSGC